MKESNKQNLYSLSYCCSYRTCLFSEAMHETLITQCLQSSVGLIPRLKFISLTSCRKTAALISDSPNAASHDTPENAGVRRRCARFVSGVNPSPCSPLRTPFLMGQPAPRIYLPQVFLRGGFPADQGCMESISPAPGPRGHTFLLHPRGDRMSRTLPFLQSNNG